MLTSSSQEFLTINSQDPKPPYNCDRSRALKAQRTLTLLLIFQNAYCSPIVLCKYLHQVEALSL